MQFKDTSSNAAPVFLVDDRLTIPLASNTTLAAAAVTSTVAVTKSGQFGYTVLMAGTSPSLTLQQLGPDGSTWIDVVTVTANGAQTITVYAGAGGAALRLKNTGANSITALTASLVS